jgi:hypothetical protein
MGAHIPGNRVLVYLRPGWQTVSTGSGRGSEPDRHMRPFCSLNVVLSVERTKTWQSEVAWTKVCCPFTSAPHSHECIVSAFGLALQPFN